MSFEKSRSVRGKLFVMLVLGVSLAVGLAACGSGSSSSTSTSSTSNTESEAGGGSENAGLARAEKAVAEAENPALLKWEGPTEPTKAIKGKKLAVLTCDSRFPGCSAQVEAAAEVAHKELGWTTKVFDGKSDPKVWNESILNALTWGANVIMVDGTTQETIQQGLTAAEEQGVPVIATSIGGSAPNPVIKPKGAWTYTSVDLNYEKTGELQGNFAITQTGGNAHAIELEPVNTASVAPTFVGFEKALEENCSSCSGEILEFSTAAIQTELGPKTVAQLRSNPEINYIMTLFDSTLTITVPEIEQASLNTQVTGAVGQNPEEASFERIENEEIQQGTVPGDFTYAGWALTDEALRALNGQKPANEGGIPFTLWDKNNLPKKFEDWTAPFDYAGEYRKLWGLS